MRLVVGLGNPGSSYARNRHNIGFMAADHLVRRHNFGPWRSKFQGLISEGTLGGERVLVLKPDTFMNLSGQSVTAAHGFYKIPPHDIIVLHDEMDLQPGKVRIKKAGGAGGHNGLKSIDSHLGQDYWRIRLGVGHPGDKALVTQWVLGDFAKADERWLIPLFDALADHLPLMFKGDGNALMIKLAQLVPPAAGPKPAHAAGGF